jgi:hypothetical protein
MTIRGQGSSLTTIERDINPVFASPRFCIFRIALTGALTLESLALRRGIATSHGGILFNEGNLTITETDVSEGLLEIGNLGGGGIRNVGTLTVRSSRIFRNSALEVRGGGILNEGMALIEDSFIFLNQAADPFLGAGGGIFNTSELILTRTNLVNNRGGFAGGALANSGRANLNSVFIWLNGVSAGFPPTPRSGGGGIFNNSSMELNIISSTIAENAAEEEGGGILDLRGRVTVTNSTIVTNHILEVVDAIRAGGIRNEDQLEIQNSILALNSGPTDPDCSGPMLSLGGTSSVILPVV